MAGDKRNRAGVFVDGAWIEGSVPLPVHNPATEEVIGTVMAAGPADVPAAIASARAAFDDGRWSGLPREERVAAVGRMLDHFAANRDAIRQTIMAETGCPISGPVMPVQFDLAISGARDLLSYYLELRDIEENPLPLHERVSATGAVMTSLKRFVPVGVVAAISAYNFPFYLNIWKVVPALITGNTVILRPSPLTPLSALLFAEAAQAAGLPPGVLNVVADAGHEGGVTLSTHPAVDMVTFTGSTVVGQEVARQAATGVKRIQLELGGKSAQIYLPDRLERAAMAARSVVLSHAGQGCALGTRILVPSAEKARLMDHMAASLSEVVIGDPADPATVMGPVITAAQQERCERYVAAAVDAGGRVITGGSRPRHLQRGYYFEPTILDLPDNSNPAAQDEIFGPVVGVIGYDSIDHAVAIANDSIYGLSGYVYGQDVRQAIAVAERLRTGTVNVNGSILSSYASSGGFGASGIGRERGLEGIRVYQQIQVMNITN